MNEILKVILKMLESPDLALIFLICLLAYIGGKMTDRRSELKSWGNRSSAGAFVAYSIYGIQKFEPASSVGLLNVAFSAVMAAGLMAGVSRIVMGVGAFLHQQFVIVPRERARKARYAAELDRELRAARRYRLPPVVVQGDVPVEVPKTRAEQIAEAEQEYQEFIVLIDAMSCKADEKESRKRFADRRRFLRLKEIFG